MGAGGGVLLLEMLRALCGVGRFCAGGRHAIRGARGARALAGEALVTTGLRLPLPGGEGTDSGMREAVGRVDGVDARDVVVGGKGDVFVGVGERTSWGGVERVLGRGGGGRIVVVRDVFDRCGERAGLRDVMRIVGGDVCAVLKGVVGGPGAGEGFRMKRFVNEYVVGQGEWRCVRNDVDLVEWLHLNGYRILPVESRTELERVERGEMPVPLQQSTNHVLMCSPTAFEFNEDAAEDNRFMNVLEAREENGEPSRAVRRRVLDEFAALHDRLVDRVNGVGVTCHLFTSNAPMGFASHELGAPDALFPNNTFSTHTNLETGKSCMLVLYPMKAESRRRERRIAQRLLSRGRYTHVYDMTREEESQRFLEGTGSLVLDRVNHIAYVALSARSDLDLARTWARVMGYTVVPFSSFDEEGHPIYHTNVMMSIGTRVAVVCSECIRDPAERHLVLDSLRSTGHHVVDITMDQVNAFCGNVLELEDFYARQCLVMSTGAFNAYTQEQREALTEHTSRLVHADIPTIEHVGGGGVRCTIAELF